MADAIRFTKPDLPLLVLCVGAIVFFAVGAGRVFRASYDLVPVYTGAGRLMIVCKKLPSEAVKRKSRPV